MSLLRKIANRVHQLWSRLFFWLKNPQRWRVRQQINQRCAPQMNNWMHSARSFFTMEGYAQAILKKGSNPKGRARSSSAAIRRSTGQTLFSLAHTKGLAREDIRQSKRVWIATLLAIFLLSACFGQRFYDQPGLDVKSISPQTFYAPESVVLKISRKPKSGATTFERGRCRCSKSTQI